MVKRNMKIVRQGGGWNLHPNFCRHKRFGKKIMLNFSTKLVFNMLVGFCDMILQQEDTISREGKR